MTDEIQIAPGGEAPPKRPPVVEPPPERQRQRATAKQRREAAAARAKRYREQRRERERDPEAEARAASEQVARAAADAAAAAHAKAKTDADARAAAAKVARNEKLLVDAIGGTAEILCDTVQVFALDNTAPHLGTERARRIGELWAPLLAPYINEETAGKLPLILAGTGTAGVLYQWAHEYRDHKAGAAQ